MPAPETLDAPADSWTALAQRLATGAPTADDLALLAVGFDTYLRARGAISLERCIPGLPTTEAQHLRLRRDEHLREAAEHLRPLQGMPRAEALSRDWNRLLTLAEYQRWREAGGPDDTAPPARRALFWASTFNRHEALAPRRVLDIIGP